MILKKATGVKQTNANGKVMYTDANDNLIGTLKQY